ncbi:tyrosine-type recombinase/integrase, partial [Escherichia coli]|nr:tyrosine-type recombinase/integrase [Escherichia coli]
WKGWAILLRQKQKKLIMLPSETMIWQPEFTDKTLSRKPGAVQALPLTLRCDAIGITLKEVIDGCRDRILSPYLIHSRHQKQPKPMSKDNLSDYFAKARDLAGVIPPAGKTPPTFHEQRSLSERLYRAQGIDTKTLLGHKVQATTDRYNDTRGQEWVKLVI